MNLCKQYIRGKHEGQLQKIGEYYNYIIFMGREAYLFELKFRNNVDANYLHNYFLSQLDEFYGAVFCREVLLLQT